MSRDWRWREVKTDADERMVERAILATLITRAAGTARSPSWRPDGRRWTRDGVDTVFVGPGLKRAARRVLRRLLTLRLASKAP